jgi:hypothetical protein
LTRLDLTRSMLLNMVLVLVYFFLVVPIGWRRRRNRNSEIALWKDSHSRNGWHPNEQSTSDPEIYRSMSSIRDELVALEREKGDRWMVVLYDVVAAMHFLAKAPKAKELSADLYEMF